MTKIHPKKKFQKPLLKKIPLAIEEAIMAACKDGTAKASGPGGSKCETNLGMGNKVPCSTIGS